jgi:polyhydroxybutyrate depolymerase
MIASRLTSAVSALMLCLFAVVAVLAMTAVAAGAASGGQPPAGCAAPATSFTLRVPSGGLIRSAQVHMPANAVAGTPLPVVLVFHGAGGTGREMAETTQFSPLADEMNFIAVYPNAAGTSRFWTLRDHAGAANDVQFISDLLDQLEAGLCVDQSRIYATGVSNGGGMTARIGCELSGRIAAIAPVAGGYRSLPPCDATRPLSVLEVHGTADTVVPYFGLAPDFAGSVLTYLAGWSQRDGCAAGPSRIGIARRAVLKTWSGCLPGVALRHLELYGVGHVWPATVGASGQTTARWIWSFLASKRR